MGFSKNMSLLLLKIYEMVAVFKCLKHSKRQGAGICRFDAYPFSLFHHGVLFD